NISEAEPLYPVVIIAKPSYGHGLAYSTPDGATIRDYIHVADLADALNLDTGCGLPLPVS
ncbi:MAG: hypothetical protein WAK24_14040, partial [Candidatus Acidiferrales bacterium]